VNTVVEFKLFMRLAPGRLSEAERKSLIDEVASDPAIGDLIPGAGGARKLRVATAGRGKSGGARAIYFNHCEVCPVYLITVYSKNEKATLTAAEVNTIFKVCKELSDAHQED